jgi:hypothetical protein
MLIVDFATSARPVTLYNSGALISAALVSATPISVYRVFGSQSSGGNAWFQMFNLAASPPGGGDVPFISPLMVENNGMFSHNLDGLRFTTGLVVAWSNAFTTYGGALTGWVTVTYV